MEFKYRHGERKERAAAASPLTNHYYSIHPSFEAGIDTLSLIRDQTSITREYLLEKIRNDRIRDEMLAMEIARKRMLEEEIWIEMENKKHYPVNGVENFDHKFDRKLELGYERSLSASRVIENDDGYIGGFGRYDELKGVAFDDVGPTIHLSREMPGRSLDMKFTTSKLCGSRRKASNNLPLPSKKQRGCSLCGVIATSKKALNRHIKGKKHKLKEAQLMKIKATPSGNSNAVSSLEEDYEQTACKTEALKDSFENGISDKPCKKGGHHRYNKKRSWCCKLCQVKCDTEAMLQFHLGGKKHKARSEAIKGKNDELVLKEVTDSEGKDNEGGGSVEEKKVADVEENDNEGEEGVSEKDNVWCHPSFLYA